MAPVWPNLTWTLFFLALLPAGASTAPSDDAVEDYDLVFEGGFRLTFGSGPDFTDELRFTGRGHGRPLGESEVAGLSYARSGPDGCSTIVHDEVTITADAGALWLENEGTDCVDVLTAPGHILIHGSGTTAILGGTGAYAGATGSGTWTVTAAVTSVGPGYVEGTFGPLRFTGHLET